MKISVVWRSCVNPGRTICEHRMWVELLWLIICWATLSDHRLLQVKIFIVRRFCQKKSKVWQILPRRSQTSAGRRPHGGKMYQPSKIWPMWKCKKTFVASQVKILTLKIKKKITLRLRKPLLTKNQPVDSAAETPTWHLILEYMTSQAVVDDAVSDGCEIACAPCCPPVCHSMWPDVMCSILVWIQVTCLRSCKFIKICHGIVIALVLSTFFCLQSQGQRVWKLLSKTYLSQNTHCLFFFGDVAALPKRCLGLWRWGVLLPLMLLVMIDKLTQKYLYIYQARALRALGLLLADGTPTVGGGKTFWAVSQIFLRKQL